MNPGNTFPLPAGICYTGLLSFIRRILERHWRKGLVCPLEGLLYAHGFSSVRLQKRAIFSTSGSSSAYLSTVVPSVLEQSDFKTFLESSAIIKTSPLFFLGDPQPCPFRKALDLNPSSSSLNAMSAPKMGVFLVLLCRFFMLLFYQSVFHFSQTLIILSNFY